MATATKPNGNGQPPPEVKRWLAEVSAGGEVSPVETFKEAAPLLRRPFTAEAVRFKVQSTWPNGNPTKAMAVTYIDARLVIERLNMIVPEHWKPRYERDGNLMWCHLTVCGLERSDVGEGVGKGLVSDSLKRSAVHFGVGVSLYATPKMFFDLGNHGFLKPAESRNGKTLKLTPKGEERCREIYADWLGTTGIPKFGEPLDHGDALNAAGDIEGEEEEIAYGDGGEPAGAEAEANARAGDDESPGAATEESQPDVRKAESPPDPEQQIADLLGKKSTLKEKRIQANEGMAKLGAGAKQRLQELQAATTGRDLDALIARVNNAMDGGGS